MAQTLKVESPVKSVQRGEYSIFKNTSISIPVAAVNMSKAVLYAYCENGHLSNYAAGSGFGFSCMFTVGAELTSSTNIDIHSGDAYDGGNAPTAANAKIYWELIEYKE